AADRDRVAGVDARGAPEARHVDERGSACGVRVELGNERVPISATRHRRRAEEGRVGAAGDVSVPAVYGDVLGEVVPGIAEEAAVVDVVARPTAADVARADEECVVAPGVRIRVTVDEREGGRRGGRRTG